MKRLVLGAAAAIVVSLIAAIAFAPAPAVTDAELAQRCAAARPAWPSYAEDIKGQIGAGPVAQWQGEPVAVRAAPGAIEAVFDLQPPWRGYPFAMPVLLRDPAGAVYNAHEAGDDGHGRRVYRFPRAAAGAAPPWVELQYPHATRRIALDSAGAWSSGG